MLDVEGAGGAAAKLMRRYGTLKKGGGAPTEGGAEVQLRYHEYNLLGPDGTLRVPSSNHLSVPIFVGIARRPIDMALSPATFSHRRDMAGASRRTLYHVLPPNAGP